LKPAALSAETVAIELSGNPSCPSPSSFEIGQA